MTTGRRRLVRDPYFAAGFAGAVPPEDLARIVSRLSGNRRPLDGSQTYEENLASNAWYPSLVSSIPHRRDRDVRHR